MTANILAVGDVVGVTGLRYLQKKLRSVKNQVCASFTVVNGENASGLGVTPAQCEDIFEAGADVITLGNHTWGRKEIIPYLDDCPYIIRPSNYAPQVPGRGWGLFDAPFGQVCVMNLIGRVGMNYNSENPFFEADRIIKACGAKVILADFHAEATSEKAALGYYLDGRISALWGTHTHVQTSDARVLPNGTGFISDVGMTGPRESVIGIKPESSISNFIGNPPKRYEEAGGAAMLNCAVFEIDTTTGRCVSAEAISISE